MIIVYFFVQKNKVLFDSLNKEPFANSRANNNNRGTNN